LQDELERRLRTEISADADRPWKDREVNKIAASIARYAPGGPDLLEAAWQKVLSERHATTYQKILALAQHLQLARPDFPIALPLERIAGLMGCNWTLVRRYRQRAVSEGLLIEVKKCIWKKMAALFVVPSPSKGDVPLTANPCTTNGPTSIRNLKA